MGNKCRVTSNLLKLIYITVVLMFASGFPALFSFPPYIYEIVLYLVDTPKSVTNDALFVFYIASVMAVLLSLINFLENKKEIVGCSELKILGKYYRSRLSVLSLTAIIGILSPCIILHYFSFNFLIEEEYGVLGRYFFIYGITIYSYTLYLFINFIFSLVNLFNKG